MSAELIAALTEAGDTYAAGEVRRGAVDWRATVIRRMQSIMATRRKHFGEFDEPAYVVAASRALRLAETLPATAVIRVD